MKFRDSNVGKRDQNKKGGNRKIAESHGEWTNVLVEVSVRRRSLQFFPSQ